MRPALRQPQPPARRDSQPQRWRSQAEHDGLGELRRERSKLGQTEAAEIGGSGGVGWGVEIRELKRNRASAP